MRAIKCVNEVGTDLFAVMQKKRLQSVAPFICGLGPIKGEQLMKQLSQESDLRMRKDLHKQRLMKRLVATNAVGFLRLNPRSSGRSGIHGFNVLDNTRIHPEFYRQVEKFAQQALEVDRADSQAVEDLMRDPSRIDILDLEAFAKVIEAKQGYMKNLLFFIANEIKRPYADVRGSYDDYAKIEFSSERLFYMLSGETPATLFRNLYIAATVVQKFEKPTGLVLKCKLENGLDAYIGRSHIDRAAGSELQPGMVVNGKIENIRFD